jgi:hypothetical protein
MFYTDELCGGYLIVAVLPTWNCPSLITNVVFPRLPSQRNENKRDSVSHLMNTKENVCQAKRDSGGSSFLAFAPGRWRSLEEREVED